MSVAMDHPKSKWKIIDPGIPYNTLNACTHSFPEYPRQYQIIQCTACYNFYKAIGKNYHDGTWSNFYWVPCNEEGKPL